MARKTYGERLRELRERAGVTGNYLATQLGFAAPAAYYRYEKTTTDKDAGSRPIPYDSVIKTIGPFLVGRGSPPVTWDELLAISTIANLPDDLQQAQKMNPRSATVAPAEGSVLQAFASAAQSKATAGIPVRWRAEAGMYMKKARLEDAPTVTQFAPVLPSGEFPMSSQWAATVVDDHAAPRFVPGDTVHCVDATQFSPSAMAGRPCLMLAIRAGDLGELLMGYVRVEKDNPVGVAVLEDGEVRGQVVGIAIRRLATL